jgi:hypothetical protein
MSFFCNNDCLTRRGVRPGVCRCCPTAEYYRNQYVIDECGRPFIRTIDIPVPINLPQFNFTAYGYYFSTFTGIVNTFDNIPFNAVGTQSFINAQLPEVILTKPGRYLINYLVHTSTGGNIAIRLGSGIVSGTTVHGDTLISGSAIVTVGFIPATVSIVNVGAPLNMIINVADGVSAQLSISEII